MKRNRQKQKMTDTCHMCLLRLILLCALFTGSSGVDDTHVFISSGEDVRLPCNNALSDCTSTTWSYSKHSETVELIALGIKKNDRDRHERLSLGSDCSLNIRRVTKEDRGSYFCRQYVNGAQQGADSHVYLHVLHVSSSSSQSEIRSGSSLTLSCQLYYYDGVTCDTLVSSEGIALIWVNQAHVNLQTVSRFQIFSSGQCEISLTTTLLNEDHNREWRCQLQQRDHIKTSATYTVKITAQTETKPPSPVSRSTSTTAPSQPDLMDSTLIPVSSSNSEKTSTQTTVTSTATQRDKHTASATTLRDIETPLTPETTSATEPDEKTSLTSSVSTLQVIGIVVAAALVFLMTAVILWVIRKKRAVNGKGTNEPVELNDDVTYTEVATYCKVKAKKKEVHDDDKVTYSSIR